jgi:hypothetical protein
MSSHVLSVTGLLSASPLAKGERIEVRGSLIFIIEVANPHPTLSLEKGEANVARII